MAFTFNVGSSIQSKSGTTMVIALGGGSHEVGNLITVAVACDNAATGANSATKDNIVGVTDSAGNTYTLAQAYTNTRSAAQGGATAALFYSVLTNDVNDGSITITNTTSGYARAGYYLSHSMGAGKTAVIVGTPAAVAGNAGADPVCTVSGLASQEYLFVGAGADENNASIAAAAGFTSSSATTTGGGAAANMAVQIVSNIEVATTKTYTPPMIGDNAAVLVAFAEVTADAWNVFDKSATMSLSNSDKTATGGGITVGARSTTVRANQVAGKYYAELTGNASVTFGIHSFTAGVTSSSESAAVSTATGTILTNGSSTGVVLGAFSASDVACMAWDAGTEKIWFRRNGDNWNNDAAADPATGTNGLDISAVMGAVNAALWCMTTSTSPNNIRTEYAEFTQTVPAGFESWMAETPDAWSYMDKSSPVQLSSNDKTATWMLAADGGVRSTQTRMNGTAGKFYAEMVFATSAVQRYGITPVSNALTSLLTNFFYRYSDGAVIVNNTSVGNIGAGATNDVLGIAWDAGAEKVWFRRNAGNWNNSGTDDPATGAGGFDCSFAAAAAHALWAHNSGTAASNVAVRTELADYTQGVPYGFTSWMGETPPVPRRQPVIRPAEAVARSFRW